MENLSTGGDTAKQCAIHNLSAFSELGEDSRKALQAVHSERASYSSGETIYASGKPAQSVYILHDGYVKLFKTTSNGKEQIIRVVRPGEIFGFDGLVDHLYNHSAVPLKHAEVCRLPIDRLQSMEGSHSEVERLIMIHCIKELQHADERLLELGAKKSAERLASFLLSWCEPDADDGWTPLVLSRREISQLLGLTIETISRLFATWKREGLIEEKQQSIHLADRDKLQALAESRH